MKKGGNFQVYMHEIELPWTILNEWQRENDAFEFLGNAWI